MSYYPVALDLRGRNVVVMGGDAEAAAKAERLLPCGPRLTVVSPHAVPAIRQLAASGELVWLARAYRPGDLRGARLVIACDRDLGAAVRGEAEAVHALLNVVDQPAACDFLAVAHFERDGLQVAIHTSGKSAALSRRLRERLQARIGTSYGELTRALGELRPAVRTLIHDPDARRAFWLDVVAPPLLERAETGDFDPEAFRAEVLVRAGSGAR